MPRIPRSVSLIVLSLALSMPMLAACGDSSSDGASSSDNSAAPDAVNAEVKTLMAAPAPIKLAAPKLSKTLDIKDKTIFIVPSSGVVFSTFVDAVKNTLSSLGARPQACDGQSNPSVEDSCMRQAITAGAAGVITIGLTYKQVPNSFDALIAAKIPVLASWSNMQSDKVGPYLAFQPSAPILEAQAKAGVAYVTAKSNAKAHVFWLGGSDNEALSAITPAIKAAYSQECPACSFNGAEVATAQLTTEGPSTLSSALLKYPKINWIQTLNMVASNAPVTQALQNTGKTGGAVATGGGGSGVALAQGIKNGTYTYGAFSSPDLMAWNMIDGLMRLLAGDKVPDSYPNVIRVFDKSNLDSIEVTPAAAASYAWFGNSSFQDDYRRLWGLGN